MISPPLRNYTLSEISGNNQLEAVVNIHFEPFEAKIVDANTSEDVKGGEILFEIVEGSGNLNGSQSIKALTDTGGIASVTMTFRNGFFQNVKVEAKQSDTSSTTTLSEKIDFIAMLDRFSDNRDGTTEVYRVKDFNGKIWMIDNLDYQTTDSWCLDNKV